MPDSDLQVGERVQMAGYRGDGLARSGTVESVQPGLVVLRDRIKEGAPEAPYRAYLLEYVEGLSAGSDR